MAMPLALVSPAAFADEPPASAADPARIGDLRRTLRDRLAASPLRDARGFSTDWHAMVERAMAEPVRK
jgi:hypothetical protein